ncbi:hypothetical protein HDU67_009198, partial [Dinochytrium kinnereticum]
MGFSMVAGAVLLVLTVVGVSVSAQGADPCAPISGEFEVTFAQAYSCMRAFPASTSFKASHVNQLKSYIDVYPFTDISLGQPRNTPQLYQLSVDIKSQLDALVTNINIKTEFDFYSRIRLIFASTHDGHLGYYPGCLGMFYFAQPWRTAAIYPDATSKRPVIRLMDEQFQGYISPTWFGKLAGKSPRDYVGWNVISIDGMDPVVAIQNYADKLSAISRDPETRFNFVLSSNTYYEGEWVSMPGMFDGTFFLGHDASPTRTYVLSNPKGGPTVTLTVPWISFPPEFYFTDSNELYAQYCAVTSFRRGSLRTGAVQPTGFIRTGLGSNTTNLRSPLGDLSEARVVAENVLEGLNNTSG